MERRLGRHATQVQRCARTGYQRAYHAALSQEDRQRAHLKALRGTQMAVLALLMVAIAHGRSVRDVARELGLGPGTLYHWRRRWRLLSDRLRPMVRGATAYTCTSAQRHEVHRVIDLLGTEISLRSLTRVFPEIARRELARILHGRWAQMSPDGGPRTCMRAVSWSGFGKVWAMDCTLLDVPDALGRPYVLVVRDLASRCLLACEACERADHWTVLLVLTRLFRQYGAPLVMKADNGSHVANRDVEALLTEHGVVPLWSPPYYPRFNGAIEAGIGRWKDRLRIIVARDDHALGITGDHLEGARLLANESGEASNGITPHELWGYRTPITVEERGAFQESLRSNQQRIESAIGGPSVPAVSEMGDAQPDGQTLPAGDMPDGQPSVALKCPEDINIPEAAQRRAVIATLVDADIVHIRSRVVYQSIHGQRRA